MPDRNSKPLSVVVIGWIWAVLGVLIAISALMALTILTLTGLPSQEEIPWPGPFGSFLSFIFNHFRMLSVGQLVFAGFVVLSAVMFLRLKSWGRRSLQAIGWVILLYFVVFGIIWIVTGINMVAMAPPDTSTLFIRVAQIAMGVIGAVATASAAAPFIVLLRFLSSRRVRIAFRGSQGGGATPAS